MALKQLMTLAVLSVGGAQVAFAQPTPDVQVRSVSMVIPKGGTVSDACHELGVPKHDLKWCWEHAQDLTGQALANPHFVRANTTIVVVLPNSVDAGAFAAPQQRVPNVGRTDLAQAESLSAVNRGLQAENETLKRENGELREKFDARDQEAARLNLDNIQKDNQLRVRDDLFEKLKGLGIIVIPPGGGLEVASEEELRRKFGVTLVGPESTTETVGPDASAARIEELERSLAESRIENDRWRAGLFGGTALALVFGAYVFLVRRKRRKEEAAKDASSEDGSTGPKHPLALGHQVDEAPFPALAPAPAPDAPLGSGAAAALPEPVVETDFTEVHDDELSSASLSMAPSPPPGMKNPGRLFDEPAQPAAPPLRVVNDDPDIAGPDKDGYYTGIWKRMLVRKYVKGSQSVVIEAVIRFRAPDDADFQRPDGSWHSFTPTAFADDVLNEVGFHVEGKFAFDDKRLNEDGVDEKPEVIFEKPLPSRADLFKHLPAEATA